MIFMGSLVVFILIWINLIVIGINFGFSFIEAYGKKESKEDSSYNLRRIKEENILIKILIIWKKLQMFSEI